MKASMTPDSSPRPTSARPRDESPERPEDAAGAAGAHPFASEGDGAIRGPGAHAPPPPGGAGPIRARFEGPLPPLARRRAPLVTLRGALRTATVPLRVAAAAAAVYVLVFNFSVVRGSSMAPGIHDGDRILIDQLSYVFGDVARGDVVVLRYPLDPSLDYIKRVVGLPGDEILMAGGRVWVNGELLAEPYIERADPSTYDFTRVREGHYFVLGDNRLHSSDSREFGQVPREYLRGKVDLRVWPPARFGSID